MPIYEPNQYQVSNIKDGDIIFVNRPSIGYRLIRRFFLNKPKLLIPEYIGSSKKVERYQEDCVLIYKYELACQEELSRCVPLLIMNSRGKIEYKGISDSVIISLDDCIIKLNDGRTIKIPLAPLKQADSKNGRKLRDIHRQELISEYIKFSRYKGKYFKEYANKYSINEWIPSYCSVCGNPVILEFKDDKVIIHNKCNCGNVRIDSKEFSYDEFAMWFHTQDDSIVRKRFNEFWFREGE